jgi:4-diphosphocytidyl-2-C-methyl-D-erythritol kinase
MAGAQVLAQAKINLVLRVLAREVSGYHQLETLLCRIALADVVTVHSTDGARSLRCGGERHPAGGLGPAEENLAWRAAEAYARRAGWPRGFAIEIDKRIPVGGGLGGGSADAGAVLRALNAMNATPLPPALVLEIAFSLGADVPFLTQDASSLALAWGRGERLLSLPPLPTRSCWLFCPDVTVATRDAYGWLAERPPFPESSLVTVDALASWDQIATLAHNDFEDVVGQRIPPVARALAELRAPSARRLVGDRPLIQMSGSGSVLFVLHLDVAHVPPRNWRSDEPGFSIIQTSTAERVEPVVLLD